MSVHAQTSGVWREIYNPQMQTSAVWRMCRGMWAQTSSVWRNIRPTTKSEVTIESSYDGKLTWYGYSDGSAESGTSAYTPASFGSLASPIYFGDAEIISCVWASNILTLRLGVADLGAAFVGFVQAGSGSSSSLTYSTGTGYSQWSATLSASPPTSSTTTLTIRGP